MNKHKIFKELFNYTEEDLWDIKDLIDTVYDARKDFERVGVPFSYEAFVAYLHRIADPQIQAHTTGPSKYVDKYVRQLKIIEGDNLDKIEDAAIEKGILPKE